MSCAGNRFRDKRLYVTHAAADEPNCMTHKPSPTSDGPDRSFLMGRGAGGVVRLPGVYLCPEPGSRRPAPSAHALPWGREPILVATEVIRQGSARSTAMTPARPWSPARAPIGDRAR